MSVDVEIAQNLYWQLCLRFLNQDHHLLLAITCIISSVVKDNHEQSILFLLFLVANYSQLVGCCEASKQHRIHVQQDTDTQTRQTLKK